MNDNVRKIFDILGVEPNEKFMLKGKGNAIYCLTENLTGCLLDIRGKDYEFFVDWLLSDVLINPKIIIKLPNEPKKKKLRDLTFEEYKKWELKNCDKCADFKCPFENVPCLADSLSCWFNYKDLYSDKFLDQEIEVEG